MEFGATPPPDRSVTVAEADPRSIPVGGPIEDFMGDLIQEVAKRYSGCEVRIME